MNIVEIVSTVMTAIIACMYGYLFLYVIIALVDRGRKRVQKNRNYKAILDGKAKAEDFLEKEPDLHKFGFIVCARNESAVIGSLIDSIKKQDYPSELYDIFVVADNCTDNTAEVAREAGAIVFERFNNKKVAKSYALDHAFQSIKERFGSFKAYDCYCVFDADNILSKGYTKAMNKEYARGYKAVQGYRNSKNFGDNWITAGYSISFLREAAYMNSPRKTIGSSSMIGGPGYLVSSDIIEENGGWKYHLLTEDIELSADLICRNINIGYSADAIFYDEQPVSFMQSWYQRLRWTRGFFQVTFKYGGKMFLNIFKNLFKNPIRSLANFDILMTLAPSTVLTLVAAAVAGVGIIFNITSFDAAVAIIPETIQTAITFILQYYFIFFAFGLVAVITEWDRIISTSAKKILFLFTYPIFMVTYVPMCFLALFSGNRWVPIKHTKSRSVEELEGAIG